MIVEPASRPTILSSIRERELRKSPEARVSNETVATRATALIALLLALAVSTPGCDFDRLEDDLSRLEEAFYPFSGTISVEGTDADAIMIVALHDAEGADIAGFRVQSRPGRFEIRSDLAPTFFFAFDDLNKDLKFQPNEPNGWAAGGRAINPAADTTDDIEITILPAAAGRPIPTRLIDEPLQNHLSDNVNINIGTVSALDDPLFSREEGRKGLWEPYAFMEDGGSGIHFLEPYDSSRAPVLFVHGIYGSPRDFAALIDSLDRSKFQAWVLSYPSGLPLSTMGNGMYQMIEVLHRQLDFDELHVVAHSMGGLVSRDALNDCVRNGDCEFVRSYTTISTPWNGVASAALGVDWAPTVVPVWRDLDPGGEFIRTLFDTPLPDHVRYHLLFGFKRDSIFGAASSDGVIELSSMLRQEAQDEADSIRGYDDDHTGILSDPAVIRKLAQILGQ